MKLDPQDPVPSPSRGRLLDAREPERPSAAGAFPISLLETFSAPGKKANDAFAIRPLVLDTNVLRNDLLRAVREKRRTAILDAGSLGGVRLLCAQHVPNEIDEHLPEWIPENLDLNTARKIWEVHYLRILRVVEVGADAPLTEEEELRIETLRNEDEDDVPTAVLGLLLNAPVLTMDQPVMRAVYGETVDVVERGDWLGDVLAGRAMSEADAFLESGVILLNSLGKVSVGGVRETMRALARMPPAGRIASVFAFGVGIMRYGEDIGRRLGTLGKAIMKLADEIAPVLEAWQNDRIKAGSRLLAGVPVEEISDERPSWMDMEKGVLVRACSRVLSRSAPVSARSLAGVLPQLPVGQSEPRVRAAVRSSSIFHALPRGQWQLGRPIERVCSSI